MGPSKVSFLPPPSQGMAAESSLPESSKEHSVLPRLSLGRRTPLVGVDPSSASVPSGDSLGQHGAEGTVPSVDGNWLDRSRLAGPLECKQRSPDYRVHLSVGIWPGCVEGTSEPCLGAKNQGTHCHVSVPGKAVFSSFLCPSSPPQTGAWPPDLSSVSPLFREKRLECRESQISAFAPAFLASSIFSPLLGVS